MDSKLLDSQYLDNNFDRYYLIQWPYCQEFDEIEDVEDDEVIPTYIQGTTTPASFVSEKLISRLKEDGF